MSIWKSCKADLIFRFTVATSINETTRTLSPYFCSFVSFILCCLIKCLYPFSLTHNNNCPPPPPTPPDPWELWLKKLPFSLRGSLHLCTNGGHQSRMLYAEDVGGPGQTPILYSGDPVWCNSHAAFWGSFALLPLPLFGLPHFRYPNIYFLVKHSHDP